MPITPLSLCLYVTVHGILISTKWLSLLWICSTVTIVTIYLFKTRSVVVKIKLCILCYIVLCLMLTPCPSLPSPVLKRDKTRFSTSHFLIWNFTHPCKRHELIYTHQKYLIRTLCQCKIKQTVLLWMFVSLEICDIFLFFYYQWQYLLCVYIVKTSRWSHSRDQWRIRYFWCVYINS
jgi:hypothetical protein